MNSEMAFESVLISRDPQVLRTVNRTLTVLSISTRICFHIPQAQKAISDSGIDLVVIDLIDNRSIDLLRELWKSATRKKPVIVGISNSEFGIPGIHLRLPRPVTQESSLKCLKEAYSRMLVDYRHHARWALMVSVAATDDTDRLVSVTVTDIGYGGVALRSQQTLEIGTVLTFRLPLPGATRTIGVQARVIWNREFGRMGCEFARIPPVDLDILHTWLKQKAIVKEPAVLV
jgi:hypothetical protein